VRRQWIARGGEDAAQMRMSAAFAGQGSEEHRRQYRLAAEAADSAK